jgi:hypothetical protein
VRESEVAQAVVACLKSRGPPLDVRERYFYLLDAEHPKVLEPADFAPLFLVLKDYGTHGFEAVERYEAYTARAVDFHIVHLRRKLEADPKSPRHILTRHGFGYQLAL